MTDLIDTELFCANCKQPTGRRKKVPAEPARTYIDEQLCDRCLEEAGDYIICIVLRDGSPCVAVYLDEKVLDLLSDNTRPHATRHRWFMAEESALLEANFIPPDYDAPARG